MPGNIVYCIGPYTIFSFNLLWFDFNISIKYIEWVTFFVLFEYHFCHRINRNQFQQSINICSWINNNKEGKNLSIGQPVRLIDKKKSTKTNQTKYIRTIWIPLNKWITTVSFQSSDNQPTITNQSFNQFRYWIKSIFQTIFSFLSFFIPSSYYYSTNLELFHVTHDFRLFFCEFFFFFEIDEHARTLIDKIFKVALDELKKKQVEKLLWQNNKRLRKVEF